MNNFSSHTRKNDNTTQYAYFQKNLPAKCTPPPCASRRRLQDILAKRERRLRDGVPMAFEDVLDADCQRELAQWGVCATPPSGEPVPEAAFRWGNGDGFPRSAMIVNGFQ